MENINSIETSIKEVMINEISIDEMESLEETLTPVFGIICGNGCWGVGCY